MILFLFPWLLVVFLLCVNLTCRFRCVSHEIHKVGFCGHLVCERLAALLYGHLVDGLLEPVLVCLCGEAVGHHAVALVLPQRHQDVQLADHLCCGTQHALKYKTDIGECRNVDHSTRNQQISLNSQDSQPNDKNHSRGAFCNLHYNVKKDKSPHWSPNGITLRLGEIRRFVEIRCVQGFIMGPMVIG